MSDFEVFRPRPDGFVKEGAEAIEVVVDKEEDLIHTSKEHDGFLESAIFEELRQMEPGDVVVVRRRSE